MIDLNGNVAGISSGGVTQAQLDAAIPVSKYVPGTMTVATLPSPASSYNGMYALTSDLFGVGGYVVSEAGFWKPVRPLAVATVANANTAMTLTPLLMAPTQVLMGTLTVARDLILDTTYAYNGARFRVNKLAGGALLGTLVKVGSTLLGTQLTNTWADYEFNGTTWLQTASGGLL